ncbi:hypothetical protein IJ732_07050, partial [bacterium]|nr:hypothetical protein [bacterium]
DNGECSQCENGYQNNGSSCRDIRENTCATYSGTTCTKCTTENLLVDNECVSKTSLHCQTSDGVSCTECNSDYHDENGTCAKGYVENCSVYDGEKCQTCNDGFYAYNSGSNCTINRELAYKTDNKNFEDKLSNIIQESMSNLNGPNWESYKNFKTGNSNEDTYNALLTFFNNYLAPYFSEEYTIEPYNGNRSPILKFADGSYIELYPGGNFDLLYFAPSATWDERIQYTFPAGQNSYLIYGSENIGN